MNATPPTSAALIVGCGYLGSRVATAWVASGRRVFALTRTRSAELTALGISPTVGDVLDPDSLTRLPEVGVVLYAVGLDRRAGRSMRDVEPSVHLWVQRQPLGGHGHGPTNF